MIELVLWKVRMENHCQEMNEKRRIKKMKVDSTDMRKQCRITCGTDVVIKHVLPFIRVYLCPAKRPSRQNYGRRIFVQLPKLAQRHRSTHDFFDISTPNKMPTKSYSLAQTPPSILVPL